MNQLIVPNPMNVSEYVRKIRDSWSRMEVELLRIKAKKRKISEKMSRWLDDECEKANERIIEAGIVEDYSDGSKYFGNF